MNVGRVLGRFAAVGVAVGSVGLAAAADQPVVVAPAAPAVVADVCPTCTAGAAGAPCGKAGCKSCGNGCNPKKPVVGQLRPGACFGYFQTQWHRWEDVCPIPYQGVGLNDAPGRSAIPAPPPVPQATPRSDAPAKAAPGPMPTTNPVPMTAPKNGIPGIPSPDGKFGK